MKLFVGLGNPGAKYARNRHNIGYMAVDRIASDHGFSPWRAKFQGVLSEGRLGTGLRRAQSLGEGESRPRRIPARLGALGGVRAPVPPPGRCRPLPRGLP